MAKALPTPNPDRIGHGQQAMTPAEVAAMFRVTVKSVTRWADSGQLPSFRTLGGHRRFRTADVAEFLSRGGQP